MDLEDQFDVIIIGTGLAESILSAACSRIGKKVLHLDNNSFYGESWGSFNFEQLVELLKFGKVNDALYFNSIVNEDLKNENDESDQQHQSNIKAINWSDFYKTIKNIEIISYLINENENKTEENLNNDQDKWWSADEFKKLSRKFNIDLCPKLLFANGSMVQLLVTSNISRYMSFKSVTRMLCNKDEYLELIQVPYSRQTIFLSNSISLIEKRILMKFIQFCLEIEKNEDLIKEFDAKPFADLMTNKGLTPFLQKVIIQCILFTSDNNIKTNEAMLLIKKFVDSSGRYGSTPFLSPLYGSGEIPQSFCRLSAVFAGTFLLNNTIDKVLINKPETENASNETFELVYRNKNIKANYLITSIDSTPKNLINSKERSMISRGIFITNRSIKKIEDENKINRDITFVCLDCGYNYHNVYLLELSSTLCVCPDNFYLVYIWLESVQSTAKLDLLPIVKKLFNFSCKEEQQEIIDLKPDIVWSCYYNVESINGRKNENLFKNHYVLSNAFNELDYDKTIQEVKEIFSSMFTNEEFLPRAPEPDEIDHLDPNPSPKIDEQENGVKEDHAMDVN